MNVRTQTRVRLWSMFIREEFTEKCIDINVKNVIIRVDLHLISTGIKSVNMTLKMRMSTPVKNVTIRVKVEVI